MQREELARLREQLLNDVVPLITETADEVDKFALLVRIIQSGNATNETYRSAYDSAKRIEEPKERLDAFLTLLDEVDLDLKDDEVIESETAQAPPENISEV